MTGTVTDQVTRMKDLYEAFGRGDIPTVLAAMDEGIEWYEAEGNPWSPGRPFVGPQQIVERCVRPVQAVAVDPLVGGVSQGGDARTQVHRRDTTLGETGDVGPTELRPDLE